MRQLFNQLMGKKPTMLTPSQMAMEELISGAQEAQADRAIQPIAPPDTSGLINTIDQRGGGTATADVFDIGGQTAPSGALGGDVGGGMGSMAMGALGGATGALNGLMSDAQKAPQMAPPAFTQGNAIRDNALGRARSGQAVPMRGLRYGGFVEDGEEVVVGEAGIETVKKHPNGDVEVKPVDDPEANARNIEAGISSLQNISQAVQDGRRYKEPPPPNLGTIRGASPLGGEYTPTADASGREPMSGEGGIAMDAPEAMADEGSAPPPRRSLLDTKRIIARNNDGLTDEGVWQAREDVLKEDQWKALNEPVKKSKWKDIGMMLLTSLNNQVNNRQDPVRTWGEIKRDEKVGALAPQLQVLQQRRAEKDARAKGELDREVLRKRVEDYGNDEAYRRDALAQRKREAFRRANPSFDATKATDAQRRALAEFGESPETVGTYDFSKPDTKMVAGTLYQRNPSTGAYEDTGVKDPSKQVVDYTIVDPDTGVTQKYSTTSERAAALKTQLKAAGMQIQAASERQQSQQTYQAGENAQNRAIDMQKFMVGYNERLQKEVKANIFKAQEEMVKIKKALDDGVIDQDTFNQMMNTVQNLMK